MKKIGYITVLCLLVSCQYIGIQKKKTKNSPIIASVYNKNLYKSDIENLLPKNASKQDSLVMVKNLINSWAKQQLLLKKAYQNITKINSKEIDYLVDEYRNSLFINDYKERLVKQQLDTSITESEVEQYYEKNKYNFKLDRDLLQIKYVHFGNNFLDKKTVVKQFKSDKEEDLKSLEDRELKFKSYQLDQSIWMTLDQVLLKIPPFKNEPRENLLKISKFIRKTDSLGVYLVSVKNVLKRNDIAPLTYITPRVKRVILHRRKLDLIRNIEKTLIDDAIKNNNFKEY